MRRHLGHTGSLSEPRFPKPQNKENGFSCAESLLTQAFNIERCSVRNAFNILLRAGEIKHLGKTGQSKLPKQSAQGPARLRPRGSACKAGLRDPGGPSLTSLVRRRADARGTESLAASGLRSGEQGSPQGAEKRTSKEALPCEWKPKPRSWFGVRVRGARQGWKGNHPQDVRGGHRARARRASYLGLELAVGRSGSLAPRDSARGQEAEDLQQEPAPGIHPPDNGSASRAAEGMGEVAGAAGPG